MQTADTLPVAETFTSLQGEGCYTGKAVHFIRLGGCDVCCEFCDSKSTWNMRRFPQTSIENIVENAVASGVGVVVVTGGEPLIHNLDKLCTQLHEKSVLCFLETAGNHPLSGEWDWICLSPKLNSPPLVENLQRANELKVIIKHPSDFEWAEENALYTNQCLHFLQPEWSVHDEITPAIINYIIHNPQWNLSLQTHKYIGIQ
ncbi:MAG: 7-carboxy-7-deazaguanine synthase QueE [Prevotellaceae bacterium]|jgi:organic radical activating enzyme|nr:7-carboxy-7-deazaguanine synthase QueE [Prevotellaceae bacterium]